MMGRKDNEINYWYALAGFTGVYWAYYEWSLTENFKSMHNLKTNLVHVKFYEKSNEGKPIYITGALHPSDNTPLKDEKFGVIVSGLSLRRKVEMFQYFQDKDFNIYSKWSSVPINSSKFPTQYFNPKWRLHDYFSTTRGLLQIGDFKVDSGILKNLKSWRGIVGQYRGDDYKQVEEQGKLVLFKSKKKYTVPKVGFYRIEHEYIPSGLPVSVIGRQSGNKIVPYKGIFIAKEGYVNANDMIGNYFSEASRIGLWMTRLICSMGIVTGVYQGTFKKNK